MPKLPLTIAIGDHPASRALRDGRILIEGVDARFPDIRPQVAAYRRMVREQEFDVCELAATTYLIAKSFGYAFEAIPVFPYRAFHHGGFVVPEASAITHPRDLAGHKVGIRAYSVTTGVWARGLFEEEYGLDGSKVTWVVDDEEHVRELQLPANVVHTEPGTSIASLLASGDLAAGLSGDAGVGRQGSPLAGWSSTEQARQPSYRPLLHAPDLQAAGWFRRTGILPIHGLITFKSGLHSEHPWLATALAEAFEAAKRDWLESRDAAYATTAEGQKYLALEEIVGPDPLPYGAEANAPSLDALQRMAVAQHLLKRPLEPEEIFVPVNQSIFRTSA